VTFRRPHIFALAMLLATAPLLTCLPTPAMTDADRGLLWVSAAIYVIGFFAAYLLGPILTKMDN